MFDYFQYRDKKAVIATGPAEFTNTPGSNNRNLFVCHACGQRYRFEYPISVGELCDLIDHFTKHHEKCEKK